ncbi:MAG: hypothetical protein HUJ86_04910 [Synergistes sp.]|nr:hypothetical protein [Synergistes sp.]
MVSESSSKDTLINKIKTVAAVLFAATVIIVSFQCTEALASVTVKGLPDWQSDPAKETLNAVYESIPPGQSAKSKAEILKTVASRLFTGYEISSESASGDTVVVNFLTSSNTEWKVNISTPQLQNPPLEWFKNDTDNLSSEIALLLQNVPLESLSWSDRSLQDKITAITEKRLQGWTPSVLIESKDDHKVLTISFAPQLPMILAVDPQFASTSLPSVFHAELRKKLLGESAPFIGLPVIWASNHSADIKSWAENYVNENKWVERSSSTAEAQFQASQISRLKVQLESSIYTINAWAAIYAGTSDKSAELGLHVGRKIELVPNFDMEGYAEGRLELNNWNVTGRFGLRWRMFRYLWLGGEWDSKDDMLWAKVSLEPVVHKIYFWTRLREDGIFNGALGWRATENISFEVEFDERDEDRWSLKMLGNL